MNNAETMQLSENAENTTITEQPRPDESTSDPGFQFVQDLARELSTGSLQIPAFPDAALRIKTALEDPEVSADKVARVVGSDPVFSARLLKVANSVLVNGAGERINDIKMAVTRMGFRLAYNTAVSIAIEQVLAAHDSEALHPYLEELWRHSVEVAAYSYAIAKMQTTINPDAAMLAGLLHDIGKFYLLSRSENYPELFNDKSALDSIVDEWHTGIGRSIMEAWHFSEEMCLVADEHEELGRAHCTPADLTDIVMVANLFSYKDDDEMTPALEWDAIPATIRLKLSEQNVADIMQESREEIDAIRQILKS